jgi:hypothetical protein
MRHLKRLVSVGIDDEDGVLTTPAGVGASPHL